MCLQSCFIRECIEDAECGRPNAKGKPCRCSCFLHNQWLCGFKELFASTFFTRSRFQCGLYCKTIHVFSQFLGSCGVDQRYYLWSSSVSIAGPRLDLQCI